MKKFKNLTEFKKVKKNGQVALIVLLVSAAVMTMGLSVSRKTVSDTKIDTNEEELKQAFNTAESGIDFYLGTGKTDFVAADNLSTAIVSVKNVGQGSTINFNQFTLVNRDQQYWLTEHLADGSVDFANYYQGNSLSVCVLSGFTGSLKVDYFYQDSGLNYQIYRTGYNFGAGTVTGFTDLVPLPGQGGCISGYRQVSLATPLGGGVRPLLLSIKVIRSGTRMYLLGSGPLFPIQGIELSSTGKVGDISTGVNRKINVLKLYQVPGFMLDAITTYGNVLSN